MDADMSSDKTGFRCSMSRAMHAESERQIDDGWSVVCAEVTNEVDNVYSRDTHINDAVSSRPRICIMAADARPVPTAVHISFGVSIQVSCF